MPALEVWCGTPVIKCNTMGSKDHPKQMNNWTDLLLVLLLHVAVGLFDLKMGFQFHKWALCEGEILFCLFSGCCRVDLDLPFLVCRGSWVMKSFNLRVKRSLRGKKNQHLKIFYLLRLKKNHSLTEICSKVQFLSSIQNVQRLYHALAALSCSFNLVWM